MAAKRPVRAETTTVTLHCPHCGEEVIVNERGAATRAQVRMFCAEHPEWECNACEVVFTLHMPKLATFASDF